MSDTNSQPSRAWWESYDRLIEAGETPIRAYHLAVRPLLLDAARRVLEEHGAPPQAYDELAERFDRLTEGLGNGAS